MTILISAGNVQRGSTKPKVDPTPPATASRAIAWSHEGFVKYGGDSPTQIDAALTWVRAAFIFYLSGSSGQIMPYAPTVGAAVQSPLSCTTSERTQLPLSSFHHTKPSVVACPTTLGLLPASSVPARSNCVPAPLRRLTVFVVLTVQLAAAVTVVAVGTASSAVVVASAAVGTSVASTTAFGSPGVTLAAIASNALKMPWC